jgi:hypothetical protein
LTIYFSHFHKKKEKQSKKYPYKRRNAMNQEQIEEILKNIDAL